MSVEYLNGLSNERLLELSFTIQKQLLLTALLTYNIPLAKKVTTNNNNNNQKQVSQSQLGFNIALQYKHKTREEFNILGSVGIGYSYSNVMVRC